MTMIQSRAALLLPRPPAGDVYSSSTSSSRETTRIEVGK